MKEVEKKTTGSAEPTTSVNDWSQGIIHQKRERSPYVVLVTQHTETDFCSTISNGISYLENIQRRPKV